MKYSSSNLDDNLFTQELSVPIKLIVEYRPNGKLLDYERMLWTTHPASSADQIVQNRGWDKMPGFDPKDVWVDGAI